MKKIVITLQQVLFAAMFPISLVSTSLDPRFNNILFGYFGQHGQSFTYIRYAVIAVLLSALVFLNKKRIHFLNAAIAMSLGAVTCAILFESTFTHHWLYNYSYILWICTAVSVASGAVFLSGTLCIKENYERFFRCFWMSFTVVYIYILYVSFIRSPGSYELTVNMRPGEGTLHFFKYILHHPDGLYISLVCIGNILIFLPLPFIVFTYFRKLPIPLFILIGILLPITVETYQYVFSCGNVDIDDLILNWGGYFIGFFILRIIQKLKINNNTLADA